MVLQRDKPVRIWGWASPGEIVKVEFGCQLKSGMAGKDGEWTVYLDPMPASMQAQDLLIRGENNEVIFSNILVGDVWVLGGQSNMEFDLARIYHGDAEVLSANFPQIRIMTIPHAESIEPETDFEHVNEYDEWNDRYDKKGYWMVCSPDAVKTFSGLGYIFGKRIHMVSQVPVGLIDVSRGGTTVESWISGKALSETPENQEMLEYWDKRIREYDPSENLRMRIRNWERRAERRKQMGLEPGPKPTEPSPSPAYDHNRPGACYNGMLSVFKGLTVKGIIFHHGYNNALSDSRPELYAVNFDLLIRDWRESFNDPDLPFGIIDFSAGGMPQTRDNLEAAMIDAAPYIREGQFKAFLNNDRTGYVSTYDQQVNWYHPQKKTEAGERIARWALAELYGFDLGWESAICTGKEIKAGKIILNFNKEIKTSDDRPFEGFAIAGSDNHFYPAKAEYLVSGRDNTGKEIQDRTKIVVWNDLVHDPEEVRYAWARNPLGNAVNATLYERILPVPPFRTDNWEYPEAP
ncbi:MAG TPA: hypothetical protein DEQ09_13075, partial [Bacteroidales bacterium]|nr:hypothetical protein [Bacteroidales bacterium]